MGSRSTLNLCVGFEENVESFLCTWTETTGDGRDRGMPYLSTPRSGNRNIDIGRCGGSVLNDLEGGRTDRQRLLNIKRSPSLAD
jgi:hypothetical protein